jgi:hypothetical protein
VASHAIEKNATRLTIGNFLTKGQVFTISVPAGLVVDLNHLPAGAFSKSFTTLAENADTVKPQVVNVSPYKGKTSVLSTEYAFDVWFDEHVQAGLGSITLKFGSTASHLMSITDPNVTLAGPKLSFSYFAGALSSAGAWQLILPPGLVNDQANNQFAGLNSTSGAPTQGFTVVAADVAAPTLSAKLPATEGSPSYGLSVSPAFQFTFNEVVQASSTGTIKLTPKYGTAAVPEVVISVTSPEVMLVGSGVMVSTSTELMPGEVYHPKIDAGAFHDVQGNAFAGLLTGYTVSTAPLINFIEAATGLFGGGSGDYFDGKRYGASAAVDKDNVIMVLAGHNGTAGSTLQLNDAYTQVSRRSVNCAASSSKFPANPLGVCSPAPVQA